MEKSLSAEEISVNYCNPHRRVVSKNMDYYRESYSRVAIHREMLQDEVRTLTYRNAIYHNKHLFKGKVVLDIGCGTGILSMFAAKAGAAKVYAVEHAEIANYAKKIVKMNQFSQIITVLKGEMDEVELPGCDKVDIIISEWMGYCLFFENMLETVIAARDKWLRPGGLIFPDKCKLFVTAIENEHNKKKLKDWWYCACDFNVEIMREFSLREPNVIDIHPNQVMSSDFMVKEVDLFEISKDDLFILTPFRLIMQRTGTVHALMTYFTVHFTKCHKPLEFSTSPDAYPTHWSQTVFYLDEVLMGKKDEEIFGLFDMRHNARNKRNLDFNIEVHFQGERGELREKNKYNMR